MSDGGKGSKARPFSVSQEEYNTRWDMIFSRDLKKEDDAKAEEEAFKQIETEQKLRGFGTNH